MDIVKSIKDVVGAIVSLTLPAEIPIEYPPNSSLAGNRAGRYLLQRGAAGEASYRWAGTPADEQRPVLSELVISHEFLSLEDLGAYLDGCPGRVAAWVRTEVFSGTKIMVLDEEHPELGVMAMSVGRHPSWMRWAAAIRPNEQHTDLSHSDLADLVLDGREDLFDDRVALALAKFRAVRTVEYDADFGDAGHEGVKVSYKGAGGQPGPNAQLGVPRDIDIRIPAYTGAWPPGEEPRHQALLRLRVVPPKGDGPPMFRLSWADARAFELAAARALVARCVEVLHKVPVYQGTPRSVRYVLPGVKV
jgi:hypothetical protein